MKWISNIPTSVARLNVYLVHRNNDERVFLIRKPSSIFNNKKKRKIERIRIPRPLPNRSHDHSSRRVSNGGCIQWAITRRSRKARRKITWNVLATRHATQRWPRGSLRIRGAEYRRPCRMIITAKESTGRERRERNSSREITGCPEVRGFPRNPISTTNKN